MSKILFCWCFFIIALLNLISLQLTSGQKFAPEKGKHVCLFTTETTRIVLRKNTTSSTNYTPLNCGVKSRPDLICPQSKTTVTIFWYPYRKVIKTNKYDCCPGWKNYQLNVGCTEMIECSISLPQHTSMICQHKRDTMMSHAQRFYKLSDARNVQFELSNNPHIPTFPVLDQSVPAVIRRTMLDSFTAHWFIVYFEVMLKGNNKTFTKALQKYGKTLFNSYNDFVEINNFFFDSVQKIPLPYFKLPSRQPGFKSIRDSNRWQEDRYFAEQRLAGLNPMAIKRVTMDGKVGVKFETLTRSLNASFDWLRALQKVSHKQYVSLEEAVEDGRLFVVDYPMYNDIPHVNDVTDLNMKDTRVMKKSSSPIALFLATQHANGDNALEPIAIQTDYKPDSMIVTPEHGNDWMVAKGQLAIADFATVEIYHHLLRTHLRLEPICVCLHRHLSEDHPLYQILRFHCRAMLQTNSYGFPKLTNEMMYTHQLFAMGHTGTFKMLNDGYKEMKWNDFDLDDDIKQRGLDNTDILSYFPYRDDGLVILGVLRSFAKDYVNLYYKDNQAVIDDYELQNFANEVGKNGSHMPDGGRGMVDMFPAKFKTRWSLARQIERIIWLVVQHAAVNYPIMEYGAFTPNMPTKLYEDFMFNLEYLNNLPNSAVTVLQSFVSMNLGTIRYDTLFDYSSDLSDEKGRNLVRLYYDKMMNEIKPMLDERNVKRASKDYLTYPYLTPNWLPNSIHT